MTNFDRYHDWFLYMASLTPEQLSKTYFMWVKYYGDPKECVSSTYTVKEIEEYLLTDVHEDEKRFEYEYGMNSEEFWKKYKKSEANGTLKEFWKPIDEHKKIHPPYDKDGNKLYKKAEFPAFR